MVSRSENRIGSGASIRCRVGRCCSWDDLEPPGVHVHLGYLALPTAPSFEIFVSQSARSDSSCTSGEGALPSTAKSLPSPPQDSPPPPLPPPTAADRDSHPCHRRSHSSPTMLARSSLRAARSAKTAANRTFTVRIENIMRRGRIGPMAVNTSPLAPRKGQGQKERAS